MSVRRSAALQLRRALTGAAGAKEVEAMTSTPWASATFSGERHVLHLVLTGPEAHARADALRDGLEERDFALCGHILIDIACTADEREAESARLTLEALTVEAD